MFYVEKKTEGQMITKGKVFRFKSKVRVTKEMFEYLKKTFPNMFKFEEEKEKEVVMKTTKKDEEKKPTKKVVRSRKKKDS